MRKIKLPESIAAFFSVLNDGSLSSSSEELKLSKSAVFNSGSVPVLELCDVAEMGEDSRIPVSLHCNVSSRSRSFSGIDPPGGPFSRFALRFWLMLHNFFFTI